MLKWQKKHALEVLNVLGEAHNEIHRLSDSGNKNAVVGLLSEAQECVSSLCKFLQLQALVDVTEEYYEKLYETSLLEVSEIPQATDRLNFCLSSITSVINTEPLKKEIVFFPYKADMWDSLESIWLAAKKDENCEAFIVPIPYYSADESGKYMTLHCETDRFPPSLPVLDWKTYNFEDRKPDVAYIHNPYDDCNHVTKIHERFCSSNLKKFVKLLVFSSYAVIYKTIDEVYCTLPGIFNSDIVVVQSEAIRNAYLSNIKHYLKRQGAKYVKKYWEGKIAALGSPKFDKVINSKREDYELPDSWKKVIFKADGARRKVVLYNTTIVELLENSVDKNGDTVDLFLQKIKWVFNIFKNYDDCVLLWRPHPLLAQTIASMRPQLYSAYKHIVTEYRRDSFGIYDDSSDVHRALAVSDALYGGWSSLNILYWAAKKPALMENSKYMPDYDRWAGFVYEFDAAVQHNGDWYVVMRYSSSLYRIDEKTRKAEFLIDMPYGKKHQIRVFIDGVSFEDKLYFAPIACGEIVCYDIKSQVLSSIPLDLERASKYSVFDDYYFSRVIEHEGYLYFIPICYPAFVRLNPKDGTVEYFDSWVNEFLRSFDLTRIWRIARDAVLVGDKIYACCQSKDAVIVFNTVNCKVQAIELNTGLPGFGFIAHDGEDFWLSPIRGNYIVKWNGQGSATVASLSVINTCTSYYYGALTCEDGKVTYYPRAGDIMAVVDIKTNDIVELYNDKSVSWNNRGFTTSVRTQGKNKIMLNNETGELILTEAERAQTIIIDPVSCFKEKQTELVKRGFEWGEDALIKCLELYTGRVVEGSYKLDIIGLISLLSVTTTEMNLSSTLPKEYKVPDIDINMFRGTSGNTIHALTMRTLRRYV